MLAVISSAWAAVIPSFAVLSVTAVSRFATLGIWTVPVNIGEASGAFKFNSVACIALTGMSSKFLLPVIVI